MADFKCMPCLLTSISLICFCSGQAMMVSVLYKLEQFEKDLHENRMSMLAMEERILNTIDVVRASLRAELKENIRDEVRKAMVENLQKESLQDMVRGQVSSEVRHLKQGYHQMKRKLHHVSRSFKDFQDETNVLHEFLLTKAEGWKNSSVRDNVRLEKELQKCTADLRTRNEQLEDLNETCQIQLSRLKTAFAVTASSQTTQHLTSTVTPPVSTTPVMTPRPEVKKSRILIAPGWSSTPYQFRQLNIHSNSLSVYPYHTVRYVTCIAYASKTRKLHIASRNPDKIVSSALDTRHVTVLRERVQTYGMAVDEDRDIVFMSTFQPRLSISRMSTQGENFTAIIDLSRYARHPRQITLDKMRKRIYGCDTERMFTVTYDGQGLTTLATGSRMYAVTLDQTAGVLYYGVQKKLMKMTVSNNVSTEVTTLNTVPWNLGLYRGTIYYSGHGSPIVGAVAVTYNTVAYTLQSVSIKSVNTLCMCLIP
ncbi:uncharacterized protein LOC124273003 [Haliotis rubra]|uniref:uncharacterized protein LOC124273003 n=1 Tax=Haliotis rubra TaxID=36100 RepID=UPI001EE55416|nr:uncharacterized protein LOC124273003 [Haliotis rubra]